jgi:hypothetical protein
MANPVDDKGNVRVDFAWGNMPLQPNDKRVAGSGGSYGAYGSTEGVDADPDFDAEYARAGIAIPSNILDVKLDDHVRATGDFELGLRPGWNGFPGYEPNTIGDGDYEVFVETSGGDITLTNVSLEFSVAGWGFKTLVNFFTGLPNGVTVTASGFGFITVGGQPLIVNGEWGAIDQTVISNSAEYLFTTAAFRDALGATSPSRASEFGTGTVVVALP